MSLVSDYITFHPITIIIDLLETANTGGARLKSLCKQHSIPLHSTRRRTHGHTEGRTDGHTHTHGRTHVGMDEWTHGRTHVRMDRQTNTRTDRHMDFSDR